MENQAKQPGFKPNEAFDVIMWVLSALSATITPLTRHSFGQDHPGIFGLAALLGMLCYAESTRSGVMLVYVAVWLVALIANRIRTFWLVRKGMADHSQYNGYPWLVMCLPFVKTERFAKALEPFLCLLAGCAVMGWSQPLGQFLVVGFFSLTAVEGLWRMKMGRRAIAMRNAEIEMRQTADLYRRGGGF